MKIETQRIEEIIILKGLASYYTRGWFQSGEIYLTQARVYFKQINNNKNIFIEKGKIKEAKVFSLLGLITNGIQIILHTGKRHYFFIDHKEVWVSEINKMINN